ncbi:hypothetical protein [Romboutsia sp.]|uniref:hypothetical protein n=1 Tax=Romboutsia sp. TaxID=1965302 RepID=UPI002C9FF7C5|nr:hypothetical protein [Romboutsia sp.]HSQ89004.1 hypothetical protein [Romboutsia sp.]
MKMLHKTRIILFMICTMFFMGFSVNESYAKEPIMEYKFTVEEQKVKRAQFIWKSCIEELRNENILTAIDVKNINSYLSKEMRSEKFEAPLKIYDRQKKALRPSTIEKMVRDKVITAEQGGKLRDKMSKYNLSNLEK